MWRMVMRGVLLLGLLPVAAEACNGTVTPDGPAAYDRPDIHGIAVFLPQVLENAVDSPFANLIRVVNKYYPAGGSVSASSRCGGSIWTSTTRMPIFVFPS